jgi:glucose/arabinose dehydrogenase
MLRNRSLLAVTAIVLGALIVIAVLALAPSSEDSSAGVLIQGDANCDQTVDTRDALADLKEVAEIEPPAACVFLAGDVDCSGAIEANDVTGILLFHANATQPSGGAGCPPIGEPVTSPTVTTSPSLIGSPTPTPTAGSPTSTPTPAPTLGTSYSAQPVLPSGYLGIASGSVIEFALIPGRPNEAIVALQSGYIYRVALDESFAPALWGDLHTLVENATGGEEGLLSVAFSPTFESDGRVYIYYTEGSPAPSVLTRYSATADDLDEGSEERLITVDQPYRNHNGGHIVFGNDGMLYFGYGDGGSSGDPGHRAQRMSTLLGKVIRIDVSAQSGYAVPEDNPFTGAPCPVDRPEGDTTTCSEIFALGFRNPFRMMNDPTSGEIWIGDVGQGDWEEVDRLAQGGNFGWACYEGFAQYDYNDPGNACSGKSFVMPRTVYSQSPSRAVTGGTIYRGSDIPELYGYYIYADFYSGHIWAVNPNDDSDAVQIADVPLNISSFTLAADGELYIVSYSDGILQLAP